MNPLTWFDAHLDLAYLAENGRDLGAPLESCAGPHQPAAVSFPSLHQGRVTHCLATIFTEADGPKDQPQSYPAQDFEAANTAGLRQLKRYQEWHRPHFYSKRAAAEARTAVDHAQSAPTNGHKAAKHVDSATHAPDFLILIEGADIILDPADIGEWRAEGVVAVGMSWWKPSRYAGGNGTDLGLTDLGRALVREIDRAGIVHDASHLSDRAFNDLLDATPETIIASHSNCRALLGGGGPGENQRHLRDEQIREIVRRNGVIGLNLFSKFLLPPGAPEGTRATIADCIAHIEHVCAIAGDRAHIGLGSDMDGGFSALGLPEGIDSPGDLSRLADALAARNWSDTEIRGFAFDNWARFWKIT